MEDKKEIISLLKKTIRILESNIDNEVSWGIDVEDVGYELERIVQSIEESE